MRESTTNGSGTYCPRRAGTTLVSDGDDAEVDVDLALVAPTRVDPSWARTSSWSTRLWRDEQVRRVERQPKTDGSTIPSRWPI